MFLLTKSCQNVLSPYKFFLVWNTFRLVLMSENIETVFVESTRPSPLFRLFLFRVADTVPEIRGVIVFGEGGGGGREAGGDFHWPILGQGGLFQDLKLFLSHREQKDWES